MPDIWIKYNSVIPINCTEGGWVITGVDPSMSGRGELTIMSGGGGGFYLRISYGSGVRVTKSGCHQ